MERNARKVYRGTVVSDKMDKTITVMVETKKHTHYMVNVLNILRNLKLTMKTTKLVSEIK